MERLNVEIERPPFDGPALPIVEVHANPHLSRVLQPSRPIGSMCASLASSLPQQHLPKRSARQWDDVVSVQKR